MKANVRVGMVLVALCVCAAVVVAQSQSEELQMLQGGWQVVAAEQRGKPFDVIRGGALVITEKNFFLKTAAGNEFKGELRLNVSASPRQLDFVHADGKVWEAIYTVDDDAFRLNYVEAGGRDKRPTLFATSSESPGTVIVMNRMTKRD
jgi:uncharacterized protein (TIGR03067 family)